MLKLDGYFDLHLHSAPAPFVRIGDSIDIAQWCAGAGMAGIVIKSHFESTVSKVHHARRAVAETHPDFKVYASIALNRGVGGINPGAVELALQQGAKVVWLPTLDAAAHAEAYGSGGTYGFKAMTLTSRRNRPSPLLTVLDAAGKLTAETKEVIDLVHDYGAILGTGHISKREIFAVADYAFGIGLKRVVITHPELATPNLDIPTMVELAKMGATMEFCAVDLLPKFHCLSLSRLMEAIDAVTPARAILSSDGGQPFNPQPHEALRIVIQSMYDSGMPLQTLQTICRDNQQALLDIAD
jgi:SpoU rRNA methylase family enzyme